MSDQIDKYMERIQKLDQIAKIAKMTGQDTDQDLLLNLEIANSGLSSSNRYLDRAYTRCVHTAVARQLNPPVCDVSIPPPPANSPFLIAGVEVETGKPVWFLLDTTREGVTVTGMSGAGKSVTQARLLTYVPESVFLYGPDTKKDVWRILRELNRTFLYVRLQDLPFNLLECPTNDPATYFGGLLEIIAPILVSDGNTWPEAASILANVRSSLGKDEPMISVNQAIQLFRDIAVKAGKEKFNTFADRLSLLARALGKNANLRKGAPIMTRYSALGIDYSGVSIQMRHAVETSFLYQLMQSRLSRGFTKGVDVMVCYDESIETYSKSYNAVAGSGRVRFQELFTNQSRTFNFGRIILAQYMSQLSECVLSNSRVLIVLRLADPAEARLAVRHLGLPDDYIPVIQSLPDGHAIIKTPDCPTVHIKVQELKLGSFPSDADIALAMSAELKWVEENSVYDVNYQDGSRIDAEASEVIGTFLRPAAPVSTTATAPEQVMPITLLADWVEFLNEILANPTFNSTQHGKHLKWGMYKASRVKDELIDSGLVIATKHKTSGRPSERLHVTPKGVASLEALSSHVKK